MNLESSCPVSRVVMDYWAGEINLIEERMSALTALNPVQYETFKTYLLTKYVDDVLTALEEMRRGTRWDQGLKVMIWTPKAQMEDGNKNPEQVTIEAFSQMASGVMKYLNFTWDAPSKNQNLMMPDLDTMIWVGTPQKTWGIPEAILPKGTSLPAKTGTLEPIILYQFYRKPIANPTPMNSRSAAPLKDQIQTATNPPQGGHKLP